MHHKNKRTVRKEVKRLDHKSARAKTRTAIDGGTPGAVHGMSWSNTLPQPPVVDEVGRHKKSSKKAAPKKDKCPCNDKHEWYKEWVVEDETFLLYSWEVRRYRWTCIHCWKVKVVKRELIHSRVSSRTTPKQRTAYRRPK